METIINIWLIINNDNVEGFKAMAYEIDGDDEDKTKFLKARAVEDFNAAYKFDAPANWNGRFMKYKKFAKMEDRGLHAGLYEEIFSHFNIPDRPLICVTPVVDGRIKTN